MKIKELKELLNSLPESMDDQEIYSVMSSGCCGDTEDLEQLEVDYYLPSKGFNGMLRLTYSSLPGYRSCIQAGATKRQDEEYWKEKK